MAEILQKSANTDRREKTLLRSGILEPPLFDTYFKVKGYEPDPRLAPFISHYWVMRWVLPEGVSYQPTEVLSDPIVHLFFTETEAFVYGIIDGKLEYSTHGTGAIAGVAFKPGGFYPFWGKDMAQLTSKRVSLSDIFPVANNEYGRRLIAQSDDNIVRTLDELLTSKPLKPYAHLSLIQDILSAIDTDRELTTVSAVAEKFHVSERTLQHIFRTYVGVGIKWVIMRGRLLATINSSYTSKRPNWAQVAADMGYSSQAHFINEFKGVVGKTPQAYIDSLHTS